MSPYYLSRTCPIDNWRIVTERPAEGEVIELDVQWYGEACVERDRRNGKQGASQGALPL